MVKETPKDKLRREINEKRLGIIEDHRPEPVVMYRGAEFLPKRWWRFTKEVGVRLFSKNGWGGRRIYATTSGTGQVLALGAAFSFGPSYGVFVITLPMLETSFGYVR